MGSRLSTRRVFLTGFMGAGKTSVGEALATRLGWRFHDLDRVIEARERRSVAEIFAATGEGGFRRSEAAALAALLAEEAEPMVLALGGGTFVQEPNRRLLENADGVTILLEADVDELKRRCSRPGAVRPLAADAIRFAQLLEERRPAYAHARHRVQTGGKEIGQVVQEIVLLLESQAVRR